jgi:phosphopantothenoylcysteine synthetase/decarboxylase
MNILVTAGNTAAPIDRVRCITNIFTGKTGASIALHAHERGHSVTLLTSRPEAVAELGYSINHRQRWTVVRYSTFADLKDLMHQQVPAYGRLDAVVHCAAVSDYLPAGVYAPAAGTRFEVEQARWQSDSAPCPTLVDRAAGKVKSDESELWLRLVRAPKLVDCIRGAWGFQGFLVKFKLEVGRGEAELLQVAEKSRQASVADLMVANTLEEAGSHAYLGPLDGQYGRVSRNDLPRRLLDAVERLAEVRSNG